MKKVSSLTQSSRRLISSLKELWTVKYWASSRTSTRTKTLPTRKAALMTSPTERLMTRSMILEPSKLLMRILATGTLSLRLKAKSQMLRLVPLDLRESAQPKEGPPTWPMLTFSKLRVPYPCPRLAVLVNPT
jgi:hypothetical protein